MKKFFKLLCVMLSVVTILGCVALVGCGGGGNPTTPLNNISMSDQVFVSGTQTLEVKAGNSVKFKSSAKVTDVEFSGAIEGVTIVAVSYSGEKTLYVTISGSVTNEIAGESAKAKLTVKKDAIKDAVVDSYCEFDVYNHYVEVVNANNTTAFLKLSGKGEFNISFCVEGNVALDGATLTKVGVEPDGKLKIEFNGNEPTATLQANTNTFNKVINIKLANGEKVLIK